MRDLTEQIFIELLRSYHDGVGVTHSAHPQMEVAGQLAKEASLMATEFNKVTKGSDESDVQPKPFDIARHEFSDLIASPIAKQNLESAITLDVFGKWLMLDKLDAIAIAKALGVTAEDLK